MIRIFFILLILLFNVVCTPDVQTEKINIVVSILPLAEFAEKIGGDKVQVSVMVPPGAAPHTYEPMPGQFIEVSSAHLYVKVGSAIDFEVAWLDKIQSMNRAMVICDASQGLERRQDTDERHHETDDPHVWLSVRNAKIMVKNISTCLCALDSVHTGYYTKNLETYLSQLDSLDTEIKELFSGKVQREFIVYHPAWTYFARDYGLTQIPVEIQGKQPTAKTMQYLIEHARANNIRIIFASPQFNRESADAIAREIGGRVEFIDPLEKNFIANMRAVAQAVSEALE
jgi:zinc transport system substrate-binding protein